MRNDAGQVAQQGNVYALRRELLASIAAAFEGNTLLTQHQIRGALARYLGDLKADLKSIAASGWGAELIPDAEILESQFPELLAELETKRARVAELSALFAAADEEDFEDADDSGVLPTDRVKAIKDELKESKALRKQYFTDLKHFAPALFSEMKAAGRLPAGSKKSASAVKGTQAEPDFDSAMNIADLAEGQRFESVLREKIQEAVTDGRSTHERVEYYVLQLKRHKALEDEAKQFKADLRAAEKKQEELVAAARAKINADEARQVIVDRLHNLLLHTYQSFLRADQRACESALENLHRKYALTSKQIETQRGEAAQKLTSFLAELGYA